MYISIIIVLLVKTKIIYIISIINIIKSFKLNKRLSNYIIIKEIDGIGNTLLR